MRPELVECALSLSKGTPWTSRGSAHIVRPADVASRPPPRQSDQWRRSPLSHPLAGEFVGEQVREDRSRRRVIANEVWRPAH